MRVKVLAFAWAKDTIGTERIQAEVPDGATVMELMRQLAELHPRLAERAESLTVAVNEEFVGREFPLSAGDEVALIPPISGGCGV